MFWIRIRMNPLWFGFLDSDPARIAINSPIKILIEANADPQHCVLQNYKISYRYVDAMRI